MHQKVIKAHLKSQFIKKKVISDRIKLAQCLVAGPTVHIYIYLIQNPVGFPEQELNELHESITQEFLILKLDSDELTKVTDDMT